MEVQTRVQELMDRAIDCNTKQLHSKAIEAINQALELDYNNITAIYFKAEIQLHIQDYKEAEEGVLQALIRIPDDGGLLMRLCDCYYRQGDYQSALRVMRRIREIEPSNTYALTRCAKLLIILNELDEAVLLLKQAITEEPENVDSISTLASVYFTREEFDKANEYYQKAYALDPKNTAALTWLVRRGTLDAYGAIDFLTTSNKLAYELLEVVDNKTDVLRLIQDVALTSLDWGLQAKLEKSELLKLHRALVFQQSRVETMQDRRDLLEAHRSWGAAVESGVDSKVIKRRARQRLNNKIRMGIVSAGFRKNHIGHYMWPLVNHLNKDKFEVYCYSQLPQVNDVMQDKFMAVADSFKKHYFRNDVQQDAQVMTDDCLDVLVEVGVWHTAPKLMAYRTAPLQISWLDYLHSMGLPTAIDYIVTDPYIKPESDDLLIEKPLVLPEVWMVMDELGFPPLPITEVLPEDQNGYITFGTMSRPHRFTEDTFRVWAGIMNMVPNSKFVYIRPETKAEIVRTNFCKNMEKYGIAKNRILFVAARDNFMEQFNKIDIALDTFPDIGNTTTCYTIWMGLPLVTLVGPCFFERVSYSALSNCGLSDLCAFSLQEYHNIAIALVADKERRRYIRKNLRSWILNGPLGQTKRFADNMGNAIANVLGRG